MWTNSDAVKRRGDFGAYVEIIRPILRGRDIKRYTYDFKDWWLIATFPAKKINIEDYPAIKAYLAGLRPKLEQTGNALTDKERTAVTLHASHYGVTFARKDLDRARKKTNNDWFETQDAIGYWDDFSKQKIVWGNMCLKAQFAIADEGFMINAPSPLLTPAEPWLLAYLNSSPADWYIRSLGVTRNGGYFEYKPMFVENLPIPRFNDKQKNKLNLLCEMAQAEAGSGKCDASSKIDSYINSVLGLTPEECAFLQVD